MATRKLETLLNMLDETQLEQWVLAYINSTLQLEQRAQRIGRKGQRQKGVDVHAVIRGVGHVGYQAKAYVSTTLTTAALDRELAAAETFVPPLQAYTVVTLNPRDATLQEHARQATLHNRCSVSVLALEDLADIAMEQDYLRKLLFQMAFDADDVEYLLSPYLVDASSLPIKVIQIEPDGELPTELRTADEWINAGMPRRALGLLSAFAGPVTQSSRVRLECRARFSLEDYTSVVRMVEEEATRPAADAGVLALGALAAEELAYHELADDWLALALTKACERNRHDVVAVYVRIRSSRGVATLPELEAFAAKALGDSSRVAGALGDAAASLGDRKAALHWYSLSRRAKPNRALAIELNEACSALVVALDEVEAGHTTDLTPSTRRLEELAERTNQCEVPGYAVAAFSTLGFGYCALGRHSDAAAAWDRALSAAAEADIGLWIRRCVHSASEGIAAPSADLIEKHATSRIARLALAMALIVTDRHEDARPYIRQVLDDPDATDEERDVAHVEQMRLMRATGEWSAAQTLDQALLLLNHRPQSVPLLSWAIVHSRAASESQRAQLRSAVSALSLTALSDEQVLGMTAELVERDMHGLAISWLHRIEALAFDDQGEVRVKEAAELAAELCLKTLRYKDAIRFRERLLRTRPQCPIAVQQYARALYESGEREGAYQVLRDGVRAGVTSSLVVLNWAMLATTLGHRRDAHHILSQARVPPAISPEDYTRMMHTRSLLGVKGHYDDVLVGLRNGFVTPENAAAVFGVGLRRRFRRDPLVEYGAIVQLQIEDSFQGTVCIVDMPAQPLPGIKTFDAPTHPWVTDLLGTRAGDIVEITQGVFAGKQASVLWVKDPSDWLIQQAHELITISPPQKTGVQPFTGEIQQQLEVTKEHLKQRREAVTDTMARATAAKMPIAALAKRFEASAREFLRADAGWKPTAHPGTSDAIARDDTVLQQHKGLVFDPITVLLLVAIGAQSLVANLPTTPAITRQGAWQLFDWYAIEREGRRATAHLQLTDDGRLSWMEYTASHRVLLLKHWRAVNRLIRESFEIVESPPIAASCEAVQLAEVLGAPQVSGFALASTLDWTLISEEELVRGAAGIFHAKSASLHRLIVYAESAGMITRTRATCWLAALIEMGWTWVAFPSWMLDHALRLDNNKRWSTASAFFDRLRTAEPTASIKALIGVLSTADSNGYRDVDLVRLRSAVFDALPRSIPLQDRTEVVRRYGTAHRSRKHRATKKMLSRWATEHA